MKGIYVDTSTIIWAYNFEGSNSRKILGLIADRKVSAFTSEKTTEELKRYFLLQSIELWKEVGRFVIASFQIVPRGKIQGEIERWKGKIKEKDLEHLTTAKALGLQTIVAFDRDFLGFEEYKTPKEFILEMGLEASESDY